MLRQQVLLDLGAWPRRTSLLGIAAAVHQVKNRELAGGIAVVVGGT